MRFFKRILVEVSSFFEADKQEEEEINLNRLAVIFLLGLLLLFGSYFLFFDESKTVYNLPSNMFLNIREGVVRLYEGVIRLYHGLIGLIRSSAVGEIKTIINSYQTISCKGCKIDTRFESEQEKELFVLDYQLSHKNWVWRQVHKVFERAFKMPVDFGWVQIRKNLYGVDLSSYKSVTVSVKGTGKPSNLEFSIIESDGDAWYYFDKTSLASKDWIEIKMPFEDFVNPEWASHGDGRKEFKNITRMDITITNFDKEVNNKVYFHVKDNELYYLL